MLNPISVAFKKAKQENRAALLTYTVAGDSSKKQSLDILKSISKSFSLLLFSCLYYPQLLTDIFQLQKQIKEQITLVKRSPIRFKRNGIRNLKIQLILF